MKSFAAAIGAVAAFAAFIGTASAQTPTTIEGFISAAKNAAGLHWPGTFLRLCIPPPAPAAAATAVTRGTRGAAPGPPARDTWYAEPAKVADNLYFLGTKVHNAWAIVGSDGIIILEALFDYDVGKEVVAGYFTVVEGCTIAARMRATGK